MADVKAIVDDGAELPEKRKLDLPSPITKPLVVNEDESGSSKRPKIEVPSEKNGSISPSTAENAAEPDGHFYISADAEEEDDDDEKDDYTAEEDEEGDEDVSEELKIVDRKGKGIMIDEKGKGKMLEDSEDDGSDDTDDCSSDDSDSDFSDGLDESDLEDDPLAEVDLDNILPSRTRRRQVQSGVRIRGDSDSNKGNNV